MKTRLEEIPELAGNVVVYRRYDIESQFERRMTKTRGRCAIIRFTRAKNTGGRKKSFYAGTFTVALFLAPLLNQREEKDADDFAADIDAKLHGWWPESIPSNGVMQLDIEDISFPDDPQYDVTLFVLKSPLLSIQPIPTPDPEP